MNTSTKEPGYVLFINGKAAAKFTGIEDQKELAEILKYLETTTPKPVVQVKRFDPIKYELEEMRRLSGIKKAD